MVLFHRHLVDMEVVKVFFFFVVELVCEVVVLDADVVPRYHQLLLLGME